MKTRTLEVIENIANSEDRKLAIIFFLYFSRFEYALKRTRFVRPTKGASADWQKYAKRNEDLLNTAKPVSLTNALEYLMGHPPKKQVIHHGTLEWEEVSSANEQYDLELVLEYVRRIRNNLFHGGKFSGGPESDISRDRKLLEASLTILQSCLEYDHHLRDIFLEGLSY